VKDMGKTQLVSILLTQIYQSVIAFPGGGGVLPYIRYIGMCRPKG